MKLSLEIRLPEKYSRGRFAEIVRQIEQQVDLLTEGRVEVVHNAATAAPTTGNHNQGDFLRNSTPSELGSASSKYVILGWICTVSGTPGTWLQCRALTGN